MEKLQPVISRNPAVLEPLFEDAHALLSTKRWFELGLKVHEILARDDVFGQRFYVFQNFIELFVEALDQLQHAKILLLIAEEMTTENALKFLSSLIEKFAANVEPSILINLKIVFLHTQNGKFETALNQLHLIEGQISEKTSKQIRAQFYRTMADLDKARGDFDSFYEHALFYLSTSHETNNHVLAYDLCMAALFSVKVCSFGELAVHPILNSLVGTPNEWLRNLIWLLNSGDSSSIPQFNDQFAPIIMANDVFKAYISVIQQKLALSVFLQLIFERPFDYRVFKFGEISEACHVPLDKVEILVMKALSSELIKGEIDEVAQELVVTWCKPKALDLQRLTHLKEEIDRWKDIVSKQMHALLTKSQPVVG